MALRAGGARSVHADGKTGSELAVGASASGRTGVTGSLSVLARLFPSRLFGYTFLGNAKRCSLNDRMQLAPDVEFVPSSLRRHCSAQRFDCLRAPRELRLWVTWPPKN